MVNLKIGIFCQFLTYDDLYAKISTHKHKNFRILPTLDLASMHSCSNYAKNQTVYKKSIALLLRRYWFSSDDVKMKFVYFFMLSKIEVLTFPKKNIFYHFEVHLRSKGSENGYIANIEYLHLNCPNFPKLSCFMVFAHTRTQ